MFVIIPAWPSAAACSRIVPAPPSSPITSYGRVGRHKRMMSLGWVAKSAPAFALLTCDVASNHRLHVLNSVPLPWRQRLETMVHCESLKGASLEPEDTCGWGSSRHMTTNAFSIVCKEELLVGSAGLPPPHDMVAMQQNKSLRLTTTHIRGRNTKFLWKTDPPTFPQAQQKGYMYFQIATRRCPYWLYQADTTVQVTAATTTTTRQHGGYAQLNCSYCTAENFCGLAVGKTKDVIQSPLLFAKEKVMSAMTRKEIWNNTGCFTISQIHNALYAMHITAHPRHIQPNRKLNSPPNYKNTTDTLSWHPNEK